MHTGTDFAAPTGTPILASGDGLVVRAQWCGGGGNCVKIKHNRRSRFKPNGDRGFRRNGNGHKSNGDFNNGSSFKRRHPGKNNQNA